MTTNQNKKVVVSSAQNKGPRKAKRNCGEVSFPCRSCTLSSDNASLGTEGTGVSTLTSSSGDRRNHQQRNGDSRTGVLQKMPPGLYNATIYEDEIQSRATQSSYISRPIDVDSLQEYEEDLDPKPTRLDLDDSRSRTTQSSFSSRPIDVDSMMEYDPDDDQTSKIPEERFEKIMNFSNKGYYEGESLLEYSSDDESVDFETGLVTDSQKDGPERRVASLKYLQGSLPVPKRSISVDLVGPIYVDTGYLVTGEAEKDNSDEEVSFQDWEFPIVEDTFDRELVGYMKGFEPPVEDLAPQRGNHMMRRKPSDATSTRSSNTHRSISTRVTFEI